MSLVGCTVARMLKRVAVLTALAIAVSAIAAGVAQARAAKTPDAVAAIARQWWASWGYPTQCPTAVRVPFDPSKGMFIGGYAYQANYEAGVACTWAINPIVEAALQSDDRYQRALACTTIFHEMGHLAGLDHDFTGARGVMAEGMADPPKKCRRRAVIG